MRLFTALSLALLLTSISALKVLTTPLTQLKRTGEYLKGSPDADRARAAFLKRRGVVTGPTSVSTINLRYAQYVVRVGIGKPPTYYHLVLDTGSSNTFCGTGSPYVRTSTSIATGQTMSISYGSGSVSGTEYLDFVALAHDFIIVNQSIGDALQSQGFSDVDGILGAGPVDLTRGTLSPGANASIPTVMNNLKSWELITNEVLGVYFAPPTRSHDINGVVTYGGIESSLYNGDLTYTPVTKTYPSSAFWGINITSAVCGNQTVIPTSTAGVVDTGTTLVLLADDYFATYLKTIPGARMDAWITGLLKIPLASVSFMRPLNFTIGGRVFTMDVAAQLIPASQTPAWGGNIHYRYGLIASLGTNSGQGLDFILGQKFMEKYYAVFDTDAKRVGFAETNHTFSTDQA